MRLALKRLIESTLRPLGFELRRIRKLADPFFVQSQMVKEQIPTIFDVGANVGDVSAIYQQLFPSCKIHAFEPFPHTFRKLQGRFDHDPTVKMNQVAVSDVEGLIPLSANSFSATNSILKTDPAASQ